MWLCGESAGEYLDCSRDFVEQRAVPWPKDDSLIPGKARYLLFGKKEERRYYRPDLDNLLVRPTGGYFSPVLIED
jgi:hypothetical protein